jgi:hypothetical protein
MAKDASLAAGGLGPGLCAYSRLRARIGACTLDMIFRINVLETQSLSDYECATDAHSQSK